MKKLLIVLLISSMTFGLFGCGQPIESTPTIIPQTEQSEAVEEAQESVEPAAEPVAIEEEKSETEETSQSAPLAIATGHVKEIEKYGHASLDISIDKFNAAGFTLGDIVTVKMFGFSADMPYLNGYYVDKGELMLRAYPGNDTIAICINYGNFAEEYGIKVGDNVSIELKEPSGAIELQSANDLVYSNNREDFESDEEFANFRPVVLGDIKEGKLYRSASPIDNKYNRAATANKLMESKGVNAVMNLASTNEEIEAAPQEELFNSDYYKALYDFGNVIALGMPIAFEDEDFARGIAKGLTFLSEHDTPYLVHCTEGKDRAGFANMVIEALMGASQEEIVEDYMISYDNYYGIKPGDDKYDEIVKNNIMPMLEIISDGDPETSTAEDAEAYLLKYGMEQGAIDTLKEKLSK